MLIDINMYMEGNASVGGEKAKKQSNDEYPKTNINDNNTWVFCHLNTTCWELFGMDNVSIIRRWEGEGRIIQYPLLYRATLSNF